MKQKRIKKLYQHENSLKQTKKTEKKIFWAPQKRGEIMCEYHTKFGILSKPNKKKHFDST